MKFLKLKYSEEKGNDLQRDLVQVVIHFTHLSRYTYLYRMTETLNRIFVNEILNADKMIHLLRNKDQEWAVVFSMINKTLKHLS